MIAIDLISSNLNIYMYILISVIETPKILLSDGNMQSIDKISCQCQRTKDMLALPWPNNYKLTFIFSAI